MVIGVTALLLPGIGNSGPEHWQSRWQAEHSGFLRVEQDEWDHPSLDSWCRNLEAAVRMADSPVILVAHSLGCLLAAHWIGRTSLTTVRGALLVAPPDPLSAVFPPSAAGFGPVPLLRISFPSILVASSNDPYCTPEFSRNCAAAWGSRLVEVGHLGHINAASGLGEWRQGLAIYEELQRIA
jgi:predicted alpha/beta hydrolase family esterase